MSYEVETSREIYRGAIMALRSDRVAMPDGGTAVREVVETLGAVAVVALDDVARVVLIRQYRHPVGHHLWEIPAGLLDVDGESALATAHRELAEEAHLRAETWHVLSDVHPSPGLSDEAIRVYLARGLSEVPAADRHVGRGEESELSVEMVDLSEAVRQVLAGEITNAASVAGLLATARARDQGWAGLRPVDAPWSGRPDRVPGTAQ